MDNTTRASALFIAVVVAFVVLYWLRDIVAPFAIAVFLWLIMDGFAKAIRRATRITPYPLALFIAVIVVFAGAGATVAVVAGSAAEFARNSGAYGARLDDLMAQLYPIVGGRGEAPTVSDFMASEEVGRFFARLAQSVQTLASNALFVFIYVAFLFAAQATFPKKLDAIFEDHDARERARRVIGDIRSSMEKYLAVQTFVSLLTAIVCYGTLRVLGLDNALFWAFLIFLLNYIPTIGSIIATILPVLFALVQYETYWEPAAVLGGIGFWQFLIGNFMQPRMQGENLNLATIVVLLGLAVWGAILGLPGMFLSSPLTVMVMAVAAQFSSTRWLAVLLSSDGRPEVGLAARAAEAETNRQA
jgi:predicted PurR-regulated permease PerM